MLALLAAEIYSDLNSKFYFRYSNNNLLLIFSCLLRINSNNSKFPTLEGEKLPQVYERNSRGSVRNVRKVNRQNRKNLSFLPNVLLEGELSVWMEHISCSGIPAVAKAFDPQPGGKSSRIDMANFGQEACAILTVHSGGVHLSLSDRRKSRVCCGSR